MGRLPARAIAQGRVCDRRARAGRRSRLPRRAGPRPADRSRRGRLLQGGPTGRLEATSSPRLKLGHRFLNPSLRGRGRRNAVAASVASWSLNGRRRFGERANHAPDSSWCSRSHVRPRLAASWNPRCPAVRARTTRTRSGTGRATTIHPDAARRAPSPASAPSACMGSPDPASRPPTTARSWCGGPSALPSAPSGSPAPRTPWPVEVRRSARGQPRPGPRRPSPPCRPPTGPGRSRASPIPRPPAASPARWATACGAAGWSCVVRANALRIASVPWDWATFSGEPPYQGDAVPQCSTRAATRPQDRVFSWTSPRARGAGSRVGKHASCDTTAHRTARTTTCRTRRPALAWDRCRSRLPRRARSPRPL